MSDHPQCGSAIRTHPHHRRECDPRTARILALREARRRGELLIDPDRIARRMLG
jgi:anti-sigma28 factor (negative regulator of flagellin synthesis)